MGLGKTLQTIAYLLYRKRQRKTECPHLIICPASLVYNWEKAGDENGLHQSLKQQLLREMHSREKR